MRQQRLRLVLGENGHLVLASPTRRLQLDRASLDEIGGAKWEGALRSVSAGCYFDVGRLIIAGDQAPPL